MVDHENDATNAVGKIQARGKDMLWTLESDYICNLHRHGLGNTIRRHRHENELIMSGNVSTPKYDTFTAVVGSGIATVLS